jgi:formate hydrogenlyase transcriptional activator
MTPSDPNAAPPRANEFEALLGIAQVITSRPDLASMMEAVSDLLHSQVNFEFSAVVLHDAATNLLRLQVYESGRRMHRVAAEDPLADERSAEWVWHNQKPLRYSIEEMRRRYPTIAPLLSAHQIQTYCLLPLTTARARLGVIGFGSMQEDAYTDAAMRFLECVAAQIAMALDNAQNCARAREYQQKLADERDHLRTLLEVTTAVVSKLDTQLLLEAVSASIRRVLGVAYTSLLLENPVSHQLQLLAEDTANRKAAQVVRTVQHSDHTPAAEAYRSHQPVVVNYEQLRELAAGYDVMRQLAEAGARSVCSVPLHLHGKVLGTLNVCLIEKDMFMPEQVSLLMEIAGQVAIAVDNAVAYQEISELKDKLAREKLYLEEEIRTDYNFEEIVGESAALQHVLRQVETVAESDSTVLILGETGTGKELIARAIHNLSRRRNRTFVKLNCAAIPTGLLESELFGHERGAFTGAISQKIGRFELAHQGTLLLDEVGDIPLELQPKLLRAVQEREFERLGSTRTVHVDVRLVVATNRDLGRMIADRQFRTDLYYRLNVFPIVVPPLRERREDIALLVRHFAQKYAQRMNRKIESIPSETMDALTRWSWPGNVRELENLIERAVILTRGPVLNVPLTELHAVDTGEPRNNGVESIVPAAYASRSLEVTEREHIVRVLREANGIVAGPRGAAARLGMKRTTLLSRMQRLGIRPRELV